MKILVGLLLMTLSATALIVAQPKTPQTPAKVQTPVPVAHHVCTCPKCAKHIQKLIGDKTRAVLDDGAPRLVNRILNDKLGQHGTYPEIPGVKK